MDPSARTLRLLALLQRHRHWTGEDLADELGVSVRTVRRDVERLRELGYPVQASRGVDGGYELAPGAVLPPLVLDDEEAVALAVGLQLSAASAADGVGEATVRAMTKVVQVMPRALRRQVETVLSATEVPRWQSSAPALDTLALATVSQCCRDSERLVFSYQSGDGAASERETEPLRLVPWQRRWYLLAYDLTRHDWRTFRLDRLREPRGTGQPFRARELPGGVEPAEYVRASLTSGWTAVHAEAVVHAGEARVSTAIGRWCRVEPIDGERTRVLMDSDDLAWQAFALGSVGADFDVVSPPELAELVSQWGERFVRAAQSRPSAPER